MTQQKLEELRDVHGEKVIECRECGYQIDVAEVIDEIETLETDAIFMPEKIHDLAYARCRNCGKLRLHEVNDTTEPEEGPKPENDADGRTESTSDEQSDSSEPFSI